MTSSPFWRETQMKTLQARQVDLSRLRRSLIHFAYEKSRFARRNILFWSYREVDLWQVYRWAKRKVNIVSIQRGKHRWLRSSQRRSRQNTMLRFQVQASTPYSDHFPITLNLASRNRGIMYSNNTPKEPPRTEGSLRNRLTKCLWKPEFKDKFIGTSSSLVQNTIVQ